MELDAWWHDDGEWVGWLFRDPAADLLRRHVFVTWLAGIDYHEAGHAAEFAPGSQLVIRPEPENPVDPLAVAVYDGSGEHLGGYLPHALVLDLPRRPYWCGVSMIERVQDWRRVELRIAVSHEPLRIRRVVDKPEPGRIAHQVYQLGLHSKRLEEARSRQSVDPMEQMRRMAGAL